MIISRVCKKCNTEKPVSEFYVYRIINGFEHRRHECAECFATRPSMSSESRKIYNLKYNYGLTWERYQEMIENGCEVCGTNDGLSVDHDHSCCPGKMTCGECIRGILCDRHNRAEGLLHGDPEEAIALAAYMMRFVKEGAEQS